MAAFSQQSLPGLAHDIVYAIYAILIGVLVIQLPNRRRLPGFADRNTLAPRQRYPLRHDVIHRVVMETRAQDHTVCTYQYPFPVVGFAPCNRVMDSAVLA